MADRSEYECLHFSSVFTAQKPPHSTRTAGYHRKIIIPTDIFTGTQNQSSFRVCDLCSCYLLADTNNFGLFAVL